MAESKEPKVSPKKKLAIVGTRKMLKGPKSPTKYSPSLFMADMNLLTAEKLSQTKEMYSPQITEFLDITENATFKDSSVDPNQALFQPFPSEIIFQQFEKKKTYEFPLSLRNLDKVARHVKVTQKRSPYFTITCSRPSGQKVAPGMEIIYTLMFTPDDQKDYNHELTCITEREKFCIPIKCIGPRALLDFPDELHFTSAPVKHLSTKSVLVRNVGKRESKIELSTKEPFTVSPAIFTLKPKDCLQVEIGFNPTLIGDHNDELVIEYDTGDIVYMQLHGSAVNINVRLDKSSLLMEDTYIGLFTQRLVILSNRSNIPVHFEWKSMATKEDEQYQRELYSQQLTDEESSSKDTFMERCLHNPSVRDRFPILSHTYQNKKKMVSDEKFLFTNQAFSIDPMEGDIWPNSQAEITTTFQPIKAINYSTVAFCDVTGRENRLPLKFKGGGLGPKLKFSFDTLDIQNVFVNSAHAYEVILENTGDIEAVYSFRQSSTLFGPNFSFNPSSGHLLPDSLQVIQISFSSTTLGKFEEDFVLDVDGSPDQLHLKIMGSVIGPTFQFNVSEINFGAIAYGFPVTREIILANMSEVVMTYSLRVPLDDKGASNRREDNQVEFTVHPQADELPPGTPQLIKVTFTPRHVKNYSTFLVMDIAEAGNDVFSLPIKANSIVPSVTLSQPYMEYGRCFLNHPYTMDIILCNSQPLQAHYEIMKLPSGSPITCTTTVPKGVIKGEERLSIPLTIRPLTKGSLCVNCCFCILGSTDPPLHVEIRCTGEGPVISVTPAQLDWGLCPVLTPIPKTLILSNESEIEAKFETIFMRENSVYSVEPQTGLIPPREKLMLTVTGDLDDAVRFIDKLTINVQESTSYTVPLTAEGNGTTMVSYPPLYPCVELGTHFSCHQNTKQFVLTNKGRRTQALSWTTEGFSMAKLRKAEKQIAAIDKKDVAKKLLIKTEIPARPMFQIIPDKLILTPSQSESIVITGYSEIPQSVTERLVCHSVIGRNPQKEKIMSVDVTGHFISPLLKFSKKEIHFTTEQLPGSDLIKHYQDLVISRVSSLPLTVLMSCNYPFSMILGDEKKQEFSLELSLVSDEDIIITIVYDSMYCKDRHSRIEDQNIEILYKEHPQKDCINLRAEVYFPNLEFESKKLDFGCLLNDTEQVKSLRMTNTSPLDLQYTWSFLKRPPVQRIDPVHDDEGVDMQSDICDTDSLEGREEDKDMDVSRSPEGVGVGGVTVTITSPSPIKEDEQQFEHQLRRSSDDGPVVVTGGLSQSLPPSEHGLDTPTSLSDTPSSVSTNDEFENKAGTASGDNKDPWQIVDDPFAPIAIEQVFDILPLYGTLQPGETQEMQITFYGHADIATEVVAVCKVHGGPSYQLILAGESSTIQYRMDKQKIQLQDVPYDSICDEEVTISNIGKVCFEYHVVNGNDTINYNELLPGIPSVQPAVGIIEALQSQTLHIKFFPGTPRPFKTPFKIQIAHFEPGTITLVGNGYYPRLSLSLPRSVLQDPSELLERIQTNLFSTKKYRKNKNKDKISLVELESEAERITIEQFIKERNLKYIDNTKSTKSRPTLPEYHLDFGSIVSGLTVTKRIVLTNIGHSSISLTAPQTRLMNTGFSVTFGAKIKDLPCGEAIDFMVQFDPASVNSGLGYAEALLPLQIVGGPVYPLKVSATVTLPSMELSNNTLDYGTVVCGQCKIITVRLYNTQQVKCQWNVVTEKLPKKISKHTPLHIRKKMKEKPPPNYFEADPSNGILLPGQKTDVQVKFMPCDEMMYTDEIPIIVHQNPDAKLTLSVTGRGSEPKIDFDKSLIEFVPISPFSEGTDAEFTISNPMSYPLEVYSLEFDQQYQKEEDMLRWVKGYDIKHRLFLPPVEIGQTLPKEIVEAYDKRHPSLDDDQIGDSKSYQDVTGPEDEVTSNTSIEHMGSQAIVDVHPHLAELQSRFPSSTVLLPQMIGVSSTSVLSHGTARASFSDPSLDGLELTPVATCIARYLGIDLSPEAALAETRKGVAVILYGPQFSGKTSQAKCLAEQYDATILNIEELIMDAISSGSTPAGIKARELCIEATVIAQKETAISAESAESPLSSKVSMGGGKKINRTSGSGKKEAEEEIKKDSPEPFSVDPLYGTPHAAPSNQLIPVKLPEELIVEIFSDRMQQTDCRKGIVFDGLKCRFVTDQIMSTALILRALGDRKHIFFVNLDIDHEGIMDRILSIKIENQKKEEEEERLKLEEEEKIQALLDISEDDYEALNPNRQREIDNIRQKRYLEKKRKKQLEKEEEKRKEQERHDEEQRFIEEEKSKGKKGRGGMNKLQQLTDQIKHSPAHGGTGSRPDSAASVRHGSLVNPSAASFGSITDPTIGKKRTGSLLEKDGEKKESELQMSFLNYKIMCEGIQNMLIDWDRLKGAVRPKKLSPTQESLEQQKMSAIPKRKGRKSQVKGGDTSPGHALAHPLQQNVAATGADQDGEEESNRKGVGVPFVSVLATPTINEVTATICDSGLPSPKEILHSLGIYHEEAPIPDPITFQVCPYPLKRRSVLMTRREHFNFISTGPDDPNIEPVIKESPEPTIVEEPDAPSDLTGSTRLRHSGSSRVKDIKDDQGGLRRKSLTKVSGKQQPKTSPSPQHHQEETLSIEEPLVVTPDLTPKRLIKFRWIIPPHGECKIKLLFSSNEEGQFDQIMNFEIMGTRRHYQLFCRGVCQFPTISRDPRIVFPNRKKTAKKGEIVHKRYIMDKESYQFGPLHCGKPRDKYREGRYLENMETINISNPTLMTSEVAICLRHDTNATTFLYEPQTLTLESGECQPLNIWAYPKAAGEFKDAVVCTVKSNPTPILFPIMAIGVEPELRLDKKHLDFGKVLLHRRESRVLHLRNNTLLPVAWKLNGLETLGDEFTFGQEQGIVQPKTEFPLNITFRAAKPISYSKRAFKIEVSDVEQIIGLINVEHVQLQAEAYDVALDISFPKGADGGVEFGTLRVFEEIKQAMSLKNRGKYEIGYNFQFDIGPNGADYSKWFILNPTSSILYAGEKSQQVTILFKPDKELVIKDEPILKCQVIDTHLGEHGEVIANIPIRFTAKSVFSKYSVSPLNDVNFGCMVITNRKNNTFTIENNGEYEFRYCVSKRVSQEMQKIRQNAAMNVTSQQPSSRLKREHSICSRSSSVTGGKMNTKHNKGDSGTLRYEVLGGNSQRLVMGVFSIAPAFGVIGPGLSQTISVECIAEKGGKHEELLSIEVSDANRKNMPMKYRVCAEVLIPGINTTDLASIFEEHRVCKELGVLGQHQFHEDGCVGVFGETEKRFLFKSVIIGQLSKARFRILNSNKIPCDVNINIRPTISTGKSKLPDVFEVAPTRASIGPHSHVYATVSFKPLAIQMYNASFEVTIDGPSQAKSKGLTFDIQGEGNLPQVAITKPKTHTGEHGHHVLLFQKLLLGEKQVLPIALSNVGTINATVTVTMGTQESEDSFGVSYSTIDEDGEEFLYTSLPLTLDIPIGQTKEILVSFRPQLVQTYKTQLKVVVDNNQFETIVVSLIGEGYQDDVVVHNIRGPVDNMSTELLKGGDIEVVRGNLLYFGGCPVSEPRSLTFTLTNYSETESIRFKWPPVAGMLTFLPSLGHLHPGSSKDINVTLLSSKPKICKYQKFAGKYWTIKYSKPVNQHSSEWDDRLKTVKWINAPANKKTEETTGTLLPAKKKVIECEPEPSHEVTSSEGGFDIDVHFSAIINNTEYDCPIKVISFKDTNILQTRIFQLPLKNAGLINLSYQWFLTNPPLILEDSSRSSVVSSTKSETDRDLSTNDYTAVEEEINVSIEPQEGEIPPGSEQMITFKFSPVEIVEFTHYFRCQITHLSPESTPLDVCVTGSSVLPYCHFDIPENDYIANRRPINANGLMLLTSGSGSIDPSTKVIEFTSTGTNHKITREFFITNPTELSYEFQWSSLDTPNSSPLTTPIFKCLTPKGQVTGGKKFQIIFEYLSTPQQLAESLWQFSIPSLSLTIPFLLVGHTFEPNVNIDRAYLNFKSMLIGTSITETIYLVNSEDSPYQFKFNEKTCQSDNPKVKLTVSPMNGIIKPNTKLPVSVSFTAIEAREFMYNLQCNIKRKTTPLSLNVKAVGHSIDVGVSVTNAKKQETILTSNGEVVRPVEFGKVSINERALWQLSVYNYCTFDLQYQLIPSDGCFKKGGVEDKLITISPLEGKIKSQDKLVSELTFSPGSQVVLKNCQVLVKIANGPSIPIILKGSGVEPKASFSFLEYDFGPRLLLQHNMSNTATLRITNNDKNDLNINCTNIKNNGIIDIVHFEPGLLPHGESMDIDYVFRPGKAIKYKETFDFEINGVYKKVVTIKGEGAMMKVETVSPAQRHVNLGSLGINEVSCKRVRLVNHGLLAVTFAVNIVPSTQVPVLHKDGVLGVTLCPIKGPPLKEATLKPKEEIDVEVKFHPPLRVPQFTEEVIMEAYGQSHPLFVIKGSCHGVEISLDINHVPFGAVVKSSRSTRRILLMNTGDIGAKFKWDTAKFSPDFSITPTAGYILSGMEVPFTITFHPQKLNQDIRYDKLTCNIEGLSPLYLTLTGMCIDQTPLKEVLHYTTTVRSKETRQITIHNKTAVQWVLHPIISGEHWSGPVSFSVPPGGVSHYELTYQPFVMTLDAQKHTGSVFFPLPDGTGLLQNLQGTSDPPKNSGSLTKEIPCKTPHTELLPVENWLRQPQRFRAFVEHVRPEKLDHSVNLYGNDYIDVPALGKKEYQLNFYSFKEGSYLSKVTFQNESTGEYQFFHVHFKSVPPGIIGTVELTTTVRQGISHTITIDNPFQTPVNMATSVNCADITVPNNFLIGGESQGKCTFEYLPLKVGETTAKLSLQSQELGSYNYELVLKATPPDPERTVHFTVSLGSSQNQQCHFSNYSRGRTEYICKIDNPDFHVERSNTVAATDAVIEVTYEPSSLGDTKAILGISSSSGGDYLIPLQGHCLTPRPQGPFNIKTGGSITIPFRNVFHQSRQFSFSVDNPLFIVKQGDTLKPRKLYNIIVQFDKGSVEHSNKSKQSDAPVKLAKLVVTCVQSASHHNRGDEGIQWTYYLRGLPP